MSGIGIFERIRSIFSKKKTDTGSSGLPPVGEMPGSDTGKAPKPFEVETGAFEASAVPPEGTSVLGVFCDGESILDGEDENTTVMYEEPDDAASMQEEQGNTVVMFEEPVTDETDDEDLGETMILNEEMDEELSDDDDTSETVLLAPQEIFGELLRKSTGEKVSIEKDNFRIGRQKSLVDYCISDNPAMGRVHAIIRCRDGQVFIIDNESKNGTFVNDVRLNENEETLLSEGDRVLLGDEEFSFTYHIS